MRSTICRILQALVLLAVASSFAQADDVIYFKKKRITASGGGGGTPSLRQAYSTYPGNAQTGVAVVAGDLIIVCFSYNVDIATDNCSDNASGGTNIYSQVGSGATDTAVPSSGRMFFAIAKASETLTITVTNRTDIGMSVHVVSGMTQILASVLDTYNSSFTASGTGHTSSSITTANASDYLIVFWFQEATSAQLTENGTNFTIRTDQSTAHYHATFDRSVTSTGTYQDTVTAGATSRWVNIIAAFKAAP
jgi:hypothetical protein